jgi:hypothetical protein
MASVSPASLFLLKLNPIEPPWYGPVCPVVWEGWHREVSPYPDLCPTPAIVTGPARNGVHRWKAAVPDLPGA